jgi:hypothetical protein
MRTEHLMYEVYADEGVQITLAEDFEFSLSLEQNKKDIDGNELYASPWLCVFSDLVFVYLAMLRVTRAISPNKLF